MKTSEIELTLWADQTYESANFADGSCDAVELSTDRGRAALARQQPKVVSGACANEWDG
jgi:hypothetical protein